MTPVAVVTGPVGVGKSTVLREADALLTGRDICHASVELEDIAYRNLAALWVNYSDAGADRLLLSLLMEQRSDLDRVHEAIPDATITVVRLHAPLAVIEARIRSTERTDPEQEVGAARWWAIRLERSTFADHIVDNSTRPPREVAAEVLNLLGWSGDGDRPPTPA